MKNLFNIFLTLVMVALIFIGCSNAPKNLNPSELVVYRNNDKYGYKDADGDIIIKAKYIGAFPFNDDLALVVTKKLDHSENWHYIDINGKTQLTSHCYRADSFSEGYAAVIPKEGAHWGYIDKTGKIVIPPQYDSAAMFEGGFATVHIGGTSGKWVVIDTKGNIVRETEKAENWKTHVQGFLSEDD